MVFSDSVRKFGLGTTVLAGIALALILGPERISSESRAAFQRAEEAFTKNVSNAQLLATARVKLKDYDVTAWKLEDNLHEVDDRIANTRNSISETETELDQQDEVLRLSKLKLISRTETFEIGGRNYSRADVERDTELRLQVCREAKVRLATQRDTLKRLDQIKSDVSANLRQVQTVRQRKAHELELLAAKIQNAEVLEHLNGLDLKFDQTGATTKFEQTVAEIERRIRDAERRANRGPSKNGGLIDWTASQRDLVAEIDAQLAKPTTTASVTKK